MVLKGEPRHGVSIALSGRYPILFGHSYRAQIDSQTVRVEWIDQSHAHSHGSSSTRPS
jgi:hypothetical protein